MTLSELFLVAMIVIFAIPYAAWRLLNIDYFAPLVVVQIVAGILLGPGVLGAAFPTYYEFVFTQQVIGALNGVAQWAVMIFVWIAGIELDLKKAWTDRGPTAVTAGLALGAPLLCGCAAATIMLACDRNWIGCCKAPSKASAASLSRARRPP